MYDQKKKIDATMALEKPNTTDLSKIHAEVNLLIQQRFLLMSLAITLFGVVSTWSISKDPLAPGSPLGSFPFIASLLILILLFVLYLVNHFLLERIRTLTTYLVVTETSSWEKDFERFRAWKYFGYTKSQSLVFIVLGTISTLFPFLLAFIQDLKIEMVTSGWILLCCGILYVIFVFGMGFLKWFDNEEDIKRKWKTLDDKR